MRKHLFGCVPWEVSEQPAHPPAFAINPSLVTCSVLAYSVDPDQLASEEAN